MAERKIEVAALNITTHPHSPERYLSLIRQAAKAKIMQNITGDKYGMIATCYPLNENKYGKTGPITGELFTFTQVDFKGEWFNQKTRDKAEDDELIGISIPDHLKPGLTRYDYVFFPEEHLLFYTQYCQGKTLVSSHAVKLLKSVLNAKQLQEKYGEVDVTAIPDADRLSSMLTIPTLEKLTLNIRRPNPDDQSKAEQEVLKRMNQLNIQEQTQEYKSTLGNSGIKLDNELTTLTHVAAKFGLVEVKGKDLLSKPVSYKTSDHPWSERRYFDPNKTIGINMLIDIALEMKSKILKRFK